MPQKLTARHYTQVRYLLIIAHLGTFVFSLCMLFVAIVQRRRYVGYFKIVAEPHRSANSSSFLMVASGAVGLVQPLLFLCIHVAYPLVRQQQWAVQDYRKRQNAEVEQRQQQAQQRPRALNANSPGQRNALMGFIDTAALTANRLRLSPTLSRREIAAEKALQETEAAAAVVSPAATAALVSSTPAQRLRHPRLRSLMSLQPPSDSPLSTTQPPSAQGNHSFSSTPQSTPMVPRGSCVAAAHTITSAFSTRSIADAEADMNSTTTPLSRSLNVDSEAQEGASEAPAAAAVPSGDRLTGSCPAVDVPKVSFSAIADGAVFFRDAPEDATAVVATTAAAASIADGSEGSPPVSDPVPLPLLKATCVMAESPGDVSTSHFGGKVSISPRGQMSKTVTQPASVTQVDVDDSNPAAAQEAARNDTASRPDASLGNSRTNLLHNPLTTLVSSSGLPLAQLLHSVHPSGTGGISAHEDSTGVLTVTPSKRSAVAIRTVALAAAGPGASSTRDAHVAARSSEGMQPPKVSAMEVRKGSHQHPSSPSDISQCGPPSAISQALPWFTPSPATAESLPRRSHLAARSSASHSKIFVRPLPPALLHTYFKSETTFRSLLTAYYTFAAVGILFMYFFGMLWMVHEELNGLNSRVSMADGWRSVFVYRKATPAIDSALCKAELDGRCSGGTSLCNAIEYASAEAAHSVSCPFCIPSQQRLISKFTMLCSVAYDPNIYYPRAFLVFLALSVLTSLMSLCVAVFSCGTGVLASVGYAALPERAEEARNAQVLLDTGGFFSPSEQAPGSHSPSSPARASPPLSHVVAEEETSLPTSPLVVAPSCERLMHTFEGLHAPSAALLPPLWTVMAEISDSGESSLVPPVSMVWKALSPSTGEARKASVHSTSNSADDTRSPTGILNKDVVASVI